MEIVQPRLEGSKGSEALIEIIIAHGVSLEEINRGLYLVHAGESIRSVY